MAFDIQLRNPGSLFDIALSGTGSNIKSVSVLSSIGLSTSSDLRVKYGLSCLNSIQLKTDYDETQGIVVNAETGDTSEFDSIENTNAVTSAISTDKFLGNYCFKAQSTGVQYFQNENVINLSSPNEIYIRAYFKIPSADLPFYTNGAEQISTANAIELYNGTSYQLAAIQFRTGRSGGNRYCRLYRFVWRYDSTSGLDTSFDDNLAMDVWHCLEVGLKAGSGDGFAKCWLNGVLVSEQLNLNQTLAPTRAIIGFSQNNAATPMNNEYILFDNIRINTEYIGPYSSPILNLQKNVSIVNNIVSKTYVEPIPEVVGNDTDGRLKYANAETNDLSQFDYIDEAESITVSTGAKNNGTYGFTIPFNGTLISQIVDWTFTGRTGDTYSRFYIYIPSGYSFGSNDVKWVSQGITSAWGSTIAVGIVMVSGVPTYWRIQIGSNYTDVDLDLNSWTCIEIKHTIAGASSGGQCWINGNLEVTDYTLDLGSQTLNRIRFGAEQGSAPANGAYIYFDDCVMDDSYIGEYPIGAITILDFETGDLSEASATYTSGGTLEVVTSEVHKGNYSLKIIPSGVAGNLGVRKSFTNQTEVYIRIYVRFPSTFRLGAYTGLTIVFVRENINTDLMNIGFHNSLASEGVPNRIVVNGADGWNYATFNVGDIPADTWHCFELYWKKGTSNDGIGRAWFNGVQIRELTTLTNQARTGVDTVTLFSWASTSYNSEDYILFDSLKVDTSYIGLYPTDYTDLNLKKNVSLQNNLELNTIATELFFNAVKQISISSNLSFDTISNLSKKINQSITNSSELNTASNLNNKINTTILSDVSLNTESILKRKVNITVENAIVFNTDPVSIYRKYSTTIISNFELNTVSLLTVKRAISGTSVIIFETAPPTLAVNKAASVSNSMTLDTGSILTKKVSVSIVSSISSNTTSNLSSLVSILVTTQSSLETSAVINRKINISITSDIVLNIPALDLNTTNNKQVTCSSTLILNTQGTISKQVSSNIVSNIELESSSILSRICRINLLNNIQFNTSAPLLLSKRVNTLTADLQVNTLGVLSNKKNVSINSSINSNTSSIITRKINSDILTFVISEFSTFNLYSKRVNSALNALEFNTQSNLYRKINQSINSNTSIETQSLLTREILTSILNAISFNTESILTVAGSTSILNSLELRTEAILKRKINVSILNSLELNTIGLLNQKFGINVSNTIISNTDSSINKKVNGLVLNTIEFNTLSSINLKKSISILSSIELTTLSNLLRKLNNSVLSEVELITLSTLLKKYQVNIENIISLETLAILDSTFVDLTSGKVHYFDLTINNKIYSLLENLNYELNIDFPINNEILEDISLNSQISDLDLVINSSKKFNLEI